jgi:hypothetical protein
MGIKDVFVKLSGTILNLVIAFAVVKIFMTMLQAKSNLVGKAFDKTKGLTNRARERAQSSRFYQGKEMGRNQRKGERQRAATEAYANAITNHDNTRIGAWRAGRLRRRAGGRSAEAQNRAYISGLGAIEKLESQETKDAAFVLEHNGINSPGQLAAIAAGRVGTDPTGRNRVDGAGNAAIRLAAIRKIISAQDAGALEQLFQAPTGSGVGQVDHQLLVSELTKESNYATSKGAGAHFVQMAPRQYTPDEIHVQAAQSLSALAPAKLAAQDGPAIQSAIAGLSVIDPSTGNHVVSLAQRQLLWDRLQDVYSDPQTLRSLKGSARSATDTIFTAVPGPPGTAPIPNIPRPI